MSPEKGKLRPTPPRAYLNPEFMASPQARGIRVLFDVVLNHPGYSTLADMQELGFGGLRDGGDFHVDKVRAQPFGQCLRIVGRHQPAGQPAGR